MDDGEGKSKKAPIFNLFLSCFGVSYHRVIDGDDVSGITLGLATTSHIKEKNRKTKQDKKTRNSCSSSCFRLKSPAATARTVPVDVVPSSEITVDLENEEAPNRSKPSESDSHSFQKLNILRNTNTKGEENPRRSRGQHDASSHSKVSRSPPYSPGFQAGSVEEVNIADGEGNGNEARVDCQKTLKGDRRSGRRPVIQNFEIGSSGSTGYGPGGTQKSTEGVGRLEGDSLVGITVVVVTALMMLACGKACAVLFTCAWLYVIPYLMNESRHGDPPARSPNQTDFDSSEYKKRVVMEGLLAREHPPA